MFKDQIKACNFLVQLKCQLFDHFVQLFLKWETKNSLIFSRSLQHEALRVSGWIQCVSKVSLSSFQIGFNRKSDTFVAFLVRCTSVHNKQSFAKVLEANETFAQVLLSLNFSNFGFLPKVDLHFQSVGFELRQPFYCSFLITSLPLASTWWVRSNKIKLVALSIHTSGSALRSFNSATMGWPFLRKNSGALIWTLGWI